MLEREWRLGEDLFQDDCVLDPITFDHIILALHAGEKNITAEAARRIFEESVEMNLEDARFILEKNMDEILRRAKIGRGDYENRKESA